MKPPPRPTREEMEPEVRDARSARGAETGMVS